MSEIRLQIDGKEVAAKEGMTILQAAETVGISIPTLCNHEKLEPYGACRICTVEAESRGRTNLVAACLYPVEQDLVVRTRSEKIDKIRKTLLQLMMGSLMSSHQLVPSISARNSFRKARWRLRPASDSGSAAKAT